MNTNFTLEDIAHFSSPQDAIAYGAQDGKSFLATSAAMVWPGLGHVLCGNYRWAMIWCTWWCCILGGFGLILYRPEFLGAAIVLIPLAILLQGCQIHHASKCARLSPLPMLQDKGSRKLAGVLLGFLALGECRAAIVCLQNNWLEICYTPTPSMSPNVSPGDLFVNFKRESYGRWDIVAVNVPTKTHGEDDRLCKRIVGLPGETVEVVGGGVLLINGKSVTLPDRVGPYQAVDTYNGPLLDPEPGAAATGCWGRPITLGPDEYFMLGDNSSISDDGRFWPAVDGRQQGAIPASRICGRVVGIIWPPERWRIFEHAANSTGG